MSRIMPAPADGRCFSLYDSRCEYNTKLQRQMGVTTESEYRAALQHNSAAAATFMKQRVASVCLPYYNVDTCPTMISTRRRP
jgi:hypothetical protein